MDTDMAAPSIEANLRGLASKPIKRPARVHEVAADVLLCLQARRRRKAADRAEIASTGAVLIATMTKFREHDTKTNWLRTVVSPPASAASIACSCERMASRVVR